jgi:acetyl esterase/lipase
LRDNGFRTINDNAVVALAFGLLVTRPHKAAEFVRLGLIRRCVKYGETKNHLMHIFPIKDTEGPVLVFVHGGAWGSGRPWMYRLVASGIAHVLDARAFVVVQYPVYPDATILKQADSILSALCRLRVGGQDFFPSTSKLVLCGHSSGANISALALLKHALSGACTPLVDSFISLAGVFDIAKHYQWEASRGVHIISPMGAAAISPSRFDESSPTILTTGLRATAQSNNVLFPPTLILHGVDDLTVPVTSSAEFAVALEQQGVKVFTAYINCSHADPLTDMMSEGPSPTGQRIEQFWSQTMSSPPRSRL